MKYIKSYNENLTVVDQRNISIDKFDNELTDREVLDLDTWSKSIPFTKDELIKLSLHFGDMNNLYRSNLTDNFGFDLNYGGFGREKISFKGVINKKSEYYLIIGHIKIRFDSNNGRKSIRLKFDTIGNVIDFFKSFEDNFNYNID